MTTLTNKTDKPMETTTKNIVISLIDSSQELVMKVVNHYKLSYEVLGYDQSNSAIIQIHYTEDQANAIKEICELVKFLEVLTVVLTISFASVCQQLQELNKNQK